MPIKPEIEEDAYFREQEMAARAKLRAKMDEDAQRVQRESRKLELADAVAALGFTGNRTKIFDLMPMVHIAWADGTVSRKERATILNVVKDRGIAPGSDAFQMVETMLEEKPSSAFMDETMAILKQTLDGKEGASLVELCIGVAEASGGFLGLGEKVDPEERAKIEEIARAFGNDALKTLHRAFAGR